MANPAYEVHANDAATGASVAQFNIDRAKPGLWTITFSNPPINLFVPTTIDELGSLMTEIEAEPLGEGRCVPVAEPRLLHRSSRRSQGS